MPFLLNRKWTLPERKDVEQKAAQVSWQPTEKALSFWSIPENDKETDQDINQLDEGLDSSSLRTLNLLSTNIFEEAELEKKIEQNYFCINLLSSNQPFLPKVNSLSKAQKMLVTRPEFAYFKKVHSSQGIYHSLLSEIERKEEAYIHRLNISSKAQIKTRKNIYEMQHRHKSQTCSVSFKGDTCSIASKKLINLAKADPSPKQNYQTKHIFLDWRRSKSKDNGKWKLKDFLDPIIEQNAETGQLKIQHMRQRETYLVKLRQIEANCQGMQAYSSINKSLQIFGRFNSAVETKLIKKQRKLQKIKQLFKK